MKKTAKKIKSGVIFLAVAIMALGFFTFKTQAQPLFYEDSGVPLILPRSTWDNSPALNKLMTWFPESVISATSTSDWQPVERIVVHYTATPNNDSYSAIARLQNIYRFHAVTNNWGDIGYNYLIDQQGRIYEGRFGGNGVRGAHAYNSKQKNNYNYGSVGISLIGTYDTSDISPPMYDSLARLIGWLSAVNSLNPSETSKTSLIWNSDTLNFNSRFSGSVVLGHHDLDATKTDAGMISLNKVRQTAGQYKAKFENYLYQAENSPKIYKILNGTRRIYNSLNDFLASGQNYSLLASISQTQLDLFSESRYLKFSDGSLLRAKNQNEVFLIEEGKKRKIETTAKEFQKLGFDFSRVREVEAGELEKYLQGSAIKFASGQNQLISDENKVYLTKDGRKHWIVSAGLFNFLGYKWSKVKTSAEAGNFLEGIPLSYPDGTLLKDKTKGKIWLFKNGQRLEFVSQDIFLKLGYKLSKVVLVDSEELNFFPLGEPVKFSNGALLRAEGRPEVYLIKSGSLQHLDATTFKKNKYSWSKVIIISAADFDALYGEKKSPAVTLIPSSVPISTLSFSPLPSSTPSLLPSFSPSPSAAPSSSSSFSETLAKKLRVAISEVSQNNFEFSANTNFDVLDKSGQIIVSKKANEKFSYQFPTAKAEIFVKIVPQYQNGISEALSFEDHPAWRPSLNYNRFHGSLEIIYSAKSNKVWLVNEIFLEDYLKGIAEMVEGEPLEHLKAMAVASRTYAYYYLLQGGKYGSDEVFHLKNTTSDQLYKGYNREVLAPSILQAVDLTKNEVLFYQNEPIVAAYSSGASEIQTSGTKNACVVWGSKFCQGYQYLSGGIKDPAGTQYSYSVCSSANHCIGLSAAGSRQFAKSGAKNYQEILKYYYTGTEIKKAY